jgi:hypothetical protein
MALSVDDIPWWVAPHRREAYLAVRDHIKANVAALPDLDPEELAWLLRPGPGISHGHHRPRA